MADSYHVVATTKDGKTMVAERMPNRSLLSLRWYGGGQMPDELKTAFADLTSATKAATAYVSKLDEKKKPKRRGTSVKK